MRTGTVDTIRNKIGVVSDRMTPWCGSEPASVKSSALWITVSPACSYPRESAHHTIMVAASLR